jgi:streptogramin lyase
MMLEADGRLWVSCTDAALVQQVDPRSNSVVAETSTPVAPDGLAMDPPFTVWVATASGPQVVGIDVGVGGVVATAEIADEGFINANQVVAYGSGSLWLPILGRGVVLRVAPPAHSVE